jgi:hypothetical protein
VVGTYDGSVQRLYVNGAEVASAPLTGPITVNTNTVGIASWAEGREPFSGTIDEVAVYGSALTAARVQAHYQAGSGAAAPDPTVKDPSNLNATAASETQINLTWVDNSTNEGEFLIQRDTSSSFTSPVTLPTWANATSYSDTGLTPGTTYYYRVRARNSTESSNYSNIANATTFQGAPPATGYKEAVLADAPAGYWRLGETSGTTAAAVAGSGTGTYRNGALLGQPSLLAGDSANKAVSFDGVNDYVSIPSSAALSPTLRVSVEAWIKPQSLPAAGLFTSIASKPESYSLQFNGPRLEFTIMQSKVRHRLQAPAGAIVAGQTYHVVGTYDGAVQRLYVNGTEVASVALTGAITVNTNTLDIASWDEGREAFNGTIDEVAVYGSALTAARVQAHYQAGAGTSVMAGLSVPTNPAVQSLLVSDDFYTPIHQQQIDYCYLHHDAGQPPAAESSGRDF